MQELLDQINANPYLKRALINPLLNEKTVSNDDEGMTLLATYPVQVLQAKVDFMLNEILKAQTENNTDALYRLEHNLKLGFDGSLYNFDDTPFVPPSE